MATSKPAPRSAAGGFGRYQLRERLAVTSTFEVFRAQLREGGRESYSLKRLLPTSEEGSALTRQLAGVGRQLMELRHENLVQVVDCGQIDGTAFVVTELIDGLDLARWRKLGRAQGVRVDLAATLYVIAQVARGLGYGHARAREDAGAVHGHLSPASIVIGRAGQVKLAGFGLAATSIDETDPGERTVELGYFAPERLAGERVDAGSDLFSLGLVLYELLTGALPFDVSDPVALARNVMSQDIPKPSTKLCGLPADVDEIVCRLLSRDRSLRYRSATDVACALEEVLSRSIYFDRAQLAALLSRIQPDTGLSSPMLTALTPESELEAEALPPPPKPNAIDSELPVVELFPLRMERAPIEQTPPMHSALPLQSPKLTSSKRRLPPGLTALIVVAAGLWTSALWSLVSAHSLPKPARVAALVAPRLPELAARQPYPTELAAPEPPVVAMAPAARAR